MSSSKPKLSLDQVLINFYESYAAQTTFLYELNIAKQAIATAIEGIIGEDEEQEIITGEDGWTAMQRIVGRNQARADIRSRLNDHLTNQEENLHV